MFIIYKAENRINGNCYIGQTSRSLIQRIYGHRNRAGDNTYFSRAINKYGKENFDWDTIAICDTKDKSDFLEKFYIKFFNTKKPNGYNLTDGGEGSTGFNHSEDTKRKMSGDKNHNFGKIGDKSPLFRRKRFDVSDRNKKRVGNKNPNFGKDAWNKGLTKEIDIRVKNSSEKMKITRWYS
jgi:group I intron endonuclease